MWAGLSIGVISKEQEKILYYCLSLATHLMYGILLFAPGVIKVKGFFFSLEALKSNKGPENFFSSFF